MSCDRKTKKSRKRFVKKKGARPGQAITEYALLSVVLMMTTLFVGTSFLPAFINAFQRYFDSFYILINLPIP